MAWMIDVYVRDVDRFLLIYCINRREAMARILHVGLCLDLPAHCLIQNERRKPAVRIVLESRKTGAEGKQKDKVAGSVLGVLLQAGQRDPCSDCFFGPEGLVQEGVGRVLVPWGRRESAVAS